MSRRQRRRALHIESLETRLALASAVVNLLGDAPDADPADGVADTDLATPGLQTTLLAAAQHLNAQGGGTLQFQISGNFSPVDFTQTVQIQGQGHTLTLPAAATLKLSAGGSLQNLKLNGNLEFTGHDGLLQSNTITGNVTMVGDRNVVLQNTLTNSNAVDRGALTIRGSHNRVEANLIGMTNTTAPGNAGHGIEIDGTTTAATHNLLLNNTIGGSAQAGVKVHGALASNNKLEANRIGVDLSGAVARSNAQGVWIVQATDTHLLNNVVSGNGVGVRIDGPAPRTLLETNIIGLTATSQPLGNAQEGVRIVAASGVTDDITLRGNTISANGGDGVFIQAAGVKLYSNRIGSDLSGQAARGNGGDGIEINNVAGVIIGQATQGNLIVANAGRGIAVLSANQTLIHSNLIGLGGNGAALGNLLGGVYVSAASEVMIGGTTANDRNLISANRLFGVALVNANSNKVQTNYIGPNLNGAGVPGGPAQPIGVLIDGGSQNIIGADGASGFGNLISGHSGPGVLVRGAAATQNKISSNVIGLRADLGGPLANGGSGVQLSDGASANLIGGATPQAANFIAGNAGHGVALDTGATLNEVKFNFIGLNPSQQVFGNGGSGVLLDHANNNLIGDPTGATGNNIRGHVQHGVHVVASTGNRIQGNSLYQNTAGGITHTGPLATLPRQIVIRDIERTGNSVTAKFEFLATPGSTVRIELYASRQASSSGFGEGELPVAAGTVVVPASGLAQVQQTFTVPDGTYIFTTATLTDATNTTYGFSRAVTTGHQPTAITSLVTSGPTNDILPITFTATLLTTSGTPTGIVEFYDGQTLLGQANVNAAKQAILSVQVPQQGVHQIYAIYKGSASYAGAISAPLALNVTAGPRPTANTDIVIVSEDGNVQMMVLANDTAPSGATLVATSVVITQQPAHGTATVHPTTGVITYKPHTNYDGPDQLRYTVTDSRGATSSPGVVNISVTDIPEPYHNKTLPLDVTGDGDITSYDVAVAINYLNAVGGHALQAPTTPVSIFVDTDGDNVFAPIDVLHIIIYLNAHGPLFAQGEAAPTAQPPAPEPATASPAALVDQALQEWLAFESLETDARKRTR